MRRLYLLAVFVLSVCLLNSAVAAEKPKKLSPPDPARQKEIASWLSEKPHGVGRPIDDREAWSAVFDSKQKNRILKRAANLLKTPLPEDDEKLYLEFSQNGNRSNYQRLRGQRHNRIGLLALAECVEDEGRFVPELEKTILSIAAERSWVLPAHDRNLKNYHGRQASVDLASSATAWQLATADYWLGDRLRPEVRLRIHEELKRRIFDPFEGSLGGTLERRIPRHWWITGRNNWNSVCLAGVVGAAVSVLDSPEQRAYYLAAAEKYIGYYLEGFGDDGYCSEGVAYWNYGFGHFLFLAETVRQQTDGRLDLYRLPKVDSIARYGRDIELVKGIAPPFADCSPGSRPSALYLAIASRRLEFGWPEAARLESMVKSGASPIPLGLFAFPDSSAKKQPATTPLPPLPPVNWFPDSQVLLARPVGLPEGSLAVAMKAGHNAELHNHNDVGSFLVARAGKTPLVDPGGEIYSRRTFSSKRYESGVLNSFGHPVPRVAGQLQAKGRAAAAKILQTDFTPERVTFRIDLTDAYPVESLARLTRSFVYERTGHGRLTVTDQVELKKPEAFETALITFGPWERLDENRLKIGETGSAVVVTINTGEIPFELVPTEIHESLPRGKIPTRLAIRLREPIERATIELQIGPAEKSSKSTK